MKTYAVHLSGMDYRLSCDISKILGLFTDLKICMVYVKDLDLTSMEHSDDVSVVEYENNAHDKGTVVYFRDRIGKVFFGKDANIKRLLQRV